MRLITFSGKGGSGVSTLAAATAVAAALSGHRALAFGLGPGLGHALGARLSSEPTTVAPGFEAVEARGRGKTDEFRDWLEQLLEWRGMDVALAEDLSALPGMNHVGRLLELSALVASGDYDMVVVDGAPLAQFLDLPGALDAAARWLDRLFAPRQSNVFEPFLRVFAGDYATAGEDVLERGRELLGRLGELRQIFVDPAVATVRIVLTPDAPSLEAAEHAVSTLSLFSWTVDGLVINKLLPDALGDSFFDPLRSEHAQTVSGIAAAVAPLPVLSAEMDSPAPRGPEALAALAARAYGGRDPFAIWRSGPPPRFERGAGVYTMTLALPFARREDLSLEQTDDCVIVHLDGHRCVFSVPREARFFDRASWTYEDGVLRVTLER